MSDLRWILLIFGVVIICGIYLYGRFYGQLKRTLERQRKAKNDATMPHFGEDKDARNAEPVVDDVVNDSFLAEEPPEHFDLELADLTDLIREAVNESKEPFLNAKASTDVDTESDDKRDDNALTPLINGNIIVINLLPRDQGVLVGPRLLSAFSKLNINFGDMQIFHYKESGQRLFSIANLVEPGTFEPESMSGFTTKGISLFMQLNDLLKPVDCFERMLEIVWELANELNADICDIRCEVMTPQTATLLLQAVKHYESKAY